MPEVRRILEAAAALSEVLTNAGVSHAFHGSVITAVLSDGRQCDEIFCIAEGGNHHPFRRVRDALSDSADFTATNSAWTNRLHVTYRRLTPPVEIEILPAGEEGPRRLDSNKIMVIQGIPYLAVSEFIRAKLKAWVIRGSRHDADDILYVLMRYWNRVDINRIQEQDMSSFVAQYPAAAVAWDSIKRKYGI